MRFNQVIYMTLFIAFVDSVGGCVSSRAMSLDALPSARGQEEIKAAQNHSYAQSLVKIPLLLPLGMGELNADSYIPKIRPENKTLVIIVPGAGKVSRKGEANDDGIKSYEKPFLVAEEWAKALAEKGFSVLSYDKRSCKANINPLCITNEQRDLDEEGITALVKDLDQVYSYALAHLSDPNTRIVLMSTTQGAQIISLAECSKKASGIVLISPIVEDLETMWVLGLQRTLNQAPENDKTQWRNKKESMQGFFTSLKRGDFPPTANVHGASVKFWLSWVDTSKTTLASLINLNKPILLIFSDQDNFARKDMINNLQNQTKANKSIAIKTYGLTDRNFISKSGILNKTVNDVALFITELNNTLKLNEKTPPLVRP